MSIGQPRSHSVFETISNVFIGYWIGVLTQIIIFPLYGIHVSFRDNASITLIFTIISLIRSYVVRRIFNKIHINMKRTKININ